MKRLMIFLMIMMLIIMATMPIQAALEVPPRPILLELLVGQYTTPIAATGEWASDNPQVASVAEDGVITAISDGYTVINCTNQKGKVTMRAEVQVGAVPETPPQVKQAIDYAISEWQMALGEVFPRFNKYTEWFRPTAHKGFGWCGAFVGYNFDKAGIAMSPEYRVKDAPALTDGSPFAVRQASQTKLFEGFLSRNRITNLPRAGYYIIYGKKGSTPYTHIALITSVNNLGNGSYALETVEGNLNSRIRRYSYIYDSISDKKENNIKPLPDNMRTQGDVFLYDYVSDFYINCFGQTWY